MTKLEKVIKGLEICTSVKNYEVCPNECPYRTEICYGATGGLMADALELLKEREWVSVNDKPPSYAELKTDKVLVLLDDGCICVSHYDECIDEGSIFGEWQQYYDPQTLGALDSEWSPLEGVTHWARLPEPPKEETGDDE